jgi:HPt (histidine-containing phosphotransfer) domain-containing protein
MTALTRAAANGNSQEISALAHALKSSSGNVGALSLSRLCQQIEEGAPHEDQERLTQLTECLKREHGRTIEALTALRQAGSAP